jgi:hypothetical protein
LVTSCAGTVFKYVTEVKIKERLKGYEDEEEEVSSYFSNLRERKILGIDRGNTRLHSLEN